MKKTLIAAGIAAVMAAPAFADVNVSGQVNVQMGKTGNAQSNIISDNVVAFSASEDLGNGMSAFAKIMIDTDGTASNGEKDAIIGLKSGMGTVVAGRMESLTEGKLMGRTNVSSDIGAGVAEGGSNYGDRNDAVAYISPTMNGFHFAAAAFVTNTLNNSAGADATDIALFYDNGPLSLAASRETVKGEGSAENQKSTVLTASYTMGDLKATITRADTDSVAYTAGDDRTDMAYNLTYKMGANTIAVGYLDDETTNGANGTDVWVVDFNHAFSKRTSIYAAYADFDVATEADYEAIIGLKHKF
jgi:hypothetical protein